MAGAAKWNESEDGSGNQIDLCCKLEPSSASLQNCLKCSSSGRFVSMLCEFGVVLILEVGKGDSDIRTIDIAKRIRVSTSELLEGHDWSSDDELFAVASGSCKVHIFQVSRDFAEILTLKLYYLPKDISFISLETPGQVIRYQLAVAGPNGVEINCLENTEKETLTVGNIIPLHTDLAIVLVSFSYDKRYLAVAAADNHFGIWEVSSLTTSSKKFWYVHLKTIRITSIEFSTNSDIIAVGCWDGSCHVYKKVENTDCFAWNEVSVNWAFNTDRVSGSLPGSFVSWSIDGKYLRATHSKDKCAIIATYNIQENTSSTTVVSCCHGDSLKGITSFRYNEETFSLYLLKSIKLCVMKWPSEDNSKRNPGAFLDPNRELLLENMFGTLWLSNPNISTSSSTFLWRKTTDKLMFEIELFERGNCKSVSMRSESVSANEEKVPLNHGSTTPFMQTQSETEKQETQVFSFQERDNLCQDNHVGIPAEVLLNKSSGRGNALNAHCHTDYNQKEIGESAQTFLSKTDANACFGESKESNGDYMQKSCDNLQYNKKDSRSDADEKEIHAPFINPLFLSCKCSKVKEQKAGLNSYIDQDWSVVYHISSQYLVVAILPLIAYVYNKDQNKWNAMVFREAVISCCIAAEKYLIILKKKRTVAVWCLKTVRSLAGADIHFSQDNTAESIAPGGSSMLTNLPQSVMVASSTLCEARIVCLNDFGKGEIITLSSNSGFQDRYIKVKAFQVFLPNLEFMKINQSLYGMVGHFLVFKQNEKQLGHRNWLFVLPEMNICRSFPAERYGTFGELLTENDRELQTLQSLVNIQGKV